MIGHLTALACASLLAGCSFAPRPVYDVTPAQTSDVWFAGRQVVTADADGVAVAVNFRESRDGRLVYQVEVANRTAEPFTVDPSLFVCRDVVSGRATPALDPETELQEVEQALAAAEASEANQETADTLFTLLDLVAGGEEDVDLGEPVDEDSPPAMARLDDDHYRWSTEALRKTTLRTGQSLGGRVTFGVPRGAREVVLELPLGDRQVQVGYRIAVVVADHGEADPAGANF